MTEQEMLKLMGPKETWTWPKVAEIVKKKYQKLPKRWDIFESEGVLNTDPHYPYLSNCAACRMVGNIPSSFLYSRCVKCFLYEDEASCCCFAWLSVVEGIDRRDETLFKEGCKAIVERCEAFLKRKE